MILTENVKNENYIHIPGFMVKDLKLKGNELLIYAIIYGFSQLDGNSFNGNLQYLADWTNSTKQGVLKNLKSLMEKNLIVKETVSDGVLNKVSYHTTKFNGVLNKVEQGVKQSLMGDETKFNANNIYNNNIYNNSDNKQDIISDNKDNIYADKVKKQKEDKIKYGEYSNVLLTEMEYNRLADDFGIEMRNKAIKFLDEYIEEKGYKSKSHNLAIRRWVIDAINKNKNNNNNQISDFFKRLENA